MVRKKPRTRLVAEVTTPNGRKTTVDMPTEEARYDSDLAHLHEIWGEGNVKEIK